MQRATACELDPRYNLRTSFAHGKLFCSQVSSHICFNIIDIKGVLGEGFQTVTFPPTPAIAKFQLHTAAGKLNAETTPTTPYGFQISCIR